MSDRNIRLFLTNDDYASRLDLDPRTLKRAVSTGAIRPAGQLTNGEFIFDGQALAADSVIARAFRRNRS
jgi:hypothetical protein